MNKTLNDYGRLQLTNTMSDLVEMFNNNANGSELVDKILSYAIDTGIFRTGNEKVNNISAGPHYNIQFPLNEINQVTFTGFVFYFKSIHKIVNDTLYLDLTTYKDSKLHLLYLKPDKTFEVLEDKYDGDEDYLFVGRFVITTGSVVQFYIMTRNAGTNPFDKNGVSYEIIKGIVPEAKTGKKLSCSAGTIKYSGINILSEINTDILDIDFGSDALNLRYITSGNKVDWTESSITDVITNKYINQSGNIDNVTSGKFTCQKVFLDYCSKDFIIQYGRVVYDSLNEALAGASNFNYDEPDVNGLYVPVAVIIVKAGATDLTNSENFHVISLAGNSNLSAATAVDPTAQALANTALHTAQDAATVAERAEGKADGAQEDATQAINDAAAAQGTANTADGKVSAHLNDTNNPHNVTKEQVGLGNVNNTTDSEKPLSTPQKNYIDGKVTELNTEIAKKASNASQTKCVVKATQPTSDDYGRAPIKGDIWIIP